MGITSVLLNDPAPFRRILKRAISKLNLGSYRFRVSIGAVPRPHYAHIIYQAAQLAARLGQKRISVLELGVAGGNGLLWLERHAEKIEKLFPVEIEVYGFDNEKGLPAPSDHRDLPYHWQEGFFSMDRERLEARLTRAKLILGDVAKTAETFFSTHAPAPIGAVVHDLDFYTSTMAGLKLFEGDSTHLMPRVYCYFDDTMGGDIEVYTEHIGERAAIAEFNAANHHRQLGVPYYLRALQALGGWVHQIWILHAFDHPRYADFISEDGQKLDLI